MELSQLSLLVYLLLVINNSFVVAYQQVKYNNDITAGQTITGQTFTPVISLHSYIVTVSATSSTRVISKVLIGSSRAYDLYNAGNATISKPVVVRFIYVGY